MSNLFMRTLFFTAWSTKRSSALPIDATVGSFGFYVGILKPANVAMGRKVATKAHWYPLLARKLLFKRILQQAFGSNWI